MFGRPLSKTARGDEAADLPAVLLEFGAYYTSAGVYVPLSHDPVPHVGEHGEVDIYWALLPRSFAHLGQARREVLGVGREDQIANRLRGAPQQRPGDGQQEHRPERLAFFLGLLGVVGEVALQGTADLLAIVAELAQRPVDLLWQHPRRQRLRTAAADP